MAIRRNMRPQSLLWLKALPRALQNGLPVASLPQVDEAAAAIEILPSSETSTIAAQHIITLGPWPEVRKRTPYPASYILDVSKLRGMENGKFYHFEVGTRESEGALQSRIRWWRFRSELAQHPDLTSPGESLSPKVSYSLGMSRFKAVAQLAIPPRFEYRNSIQPTTVSLSNPTDITVSVEVTLKAASIYTIYSQSLTDQPHTTVLHDRINLFCFDLVDLDTQEIISGEARMSMEPGPERRLFQLIWADNASENLSTKKSIT